LSVKLPNPLKFSGLILACMFLFNSVQAQLTANFTSDIQSGCAPLVVNFLNLSTGNPTSNLWNLGNGNPIIDIQNPVATYFNPGTYTVKLTIKNAAGTEDSITKTDFITVLAPPLINFKVDDSAGCFKHNVQFTDQTTASQSTISSWFWDFGDGTNSNLQNPAHTYTLIGDFTVNLTVKLNNGCDATGTHPNFIDVTQGVVADFISPPATGCKPPIILPLQNLTTGPGTLTFNWDFGNGSPPSTAVNPIATYNTSGNYTITLIANSSAGCSDTAKKNVFIPSVTVSSSFTAPDTACLGQPVSFQNTSSPDPDTSFWTFGDGTSSQALNPVKIFNTAGLYTVKMVNKFGICVDSFSKTIFISPPPVVSFTSTNPISCRTPHSVTYTSNSPGAVSWLWNFGVGNAVGPSPTRIYTDTGSFPVRLTVTNANGCTNSQLINNYVRIGRPKVSILNLPDSGCLPFTLTPNISTYTVDGIQSYFWDFGDGFTSSSPTPPTHQYTVPGSYTFKLRIVTNGGCTDSVVIPNAVSVGVSPANGTADFTGAPLSTCAGQAINFFDLSPNPASITGWRWDFGDNGISFDQNPQHAYSDTGKFTVKLTIFNNGCGDTISKIDYVNIFGAVALFNYSVDCSNKRQVRFRDSSLNASTISWDFGDGSPPVSTPNPTHVFPANGDYTVSLTATNGGCVFVLQKVLKIIDEPATFTINPNPLCKGDMVTFRATGSIDTNVVKYEWDFGSGIFVAGPRTTQTTFVTTGLFTTRLRVTDDNGCRDTASVILPVGGPKAGLGAINPTGCKGLTVNFIDSSKTDGVNGIITRIWDFGDGVVQTINAPPFQHTYNNAGTYSVKLKIIDAGGCTDSIRFNNFITTSEPKAAFSSNDTLSCPGNRVQFINQTGGSINNFTWTFGDGAGSILNTPSHVYTSVGNYSVKLKIRDRYGCEDSLTRINYIVVDTPYANFTLSDTLSTCPPLNVKFTFAGRFNKSIKWEFGDGGTSNITNPEKTYNLPGTYITKLIVTSPGGCTDTMQKTIIIKGPNAVITYSPLDGCDSLTVNFRALNTKNVDSVLWFFADGTIFTGDSITTHKYTAPGFYLPQVILKDINGCRVPILGIDTIKVVGTTPAFVASSTLLCDRGSVQFTDSTKGNGNVTSWRWDFGDGSSSNLQNPLHFYAAPGFYSVKLTVRTDLGCIDSITVNNYIKIVRSPVTDIVSSDTSVCQQGSILFQGIETVPDTSALSWSWDFANGQTSLLQNPPAQLYVTPGNFTVRMIVTNSSSCKDTVDQPITINPLPIANAGLDSTICLGDQVQLNATGATTYQWLPPVNNLSCTNCANPIANPTVTTTYIVRGTTAFGCEDTDSVTITVIQPSTVVAPADDSLCIGQSLSLKATGTQLYTWTPATGLNNPNIANPTANPVVTTTYTVTGSDQFGCFITQDSVLISVFPLPTVNAGRDTTILSGTNNLLLSPIYSNDVLAYLWSPTTGLSCTTCPNPVAAPKVSTTYTVTATNNGGCKASDALTVIVVCNNNNIFMPNTFSPNGDGMNDVYYPRGRGINTIRSMRIFNRWGQQVYSRQSFNANEITAGWDGKFQGKELPPDVYVYILELVCENQTIISLKGDITLVR